MDVRFPEKAGNLNKALLERYYTTYYMYVHNLFKASGVKVNLIGDTSVADGVFLVYINKKVVAFDFSDHLKIWPNVYNNKDVTAYFKFHYSIDRHEKFIKAYPFPPVSFYNWKQYFSLSKEITYKANGPHISCRQKPYGNARIRRAGVQSVLKDFIKNAKANGMLKDKIVCVGLKSQIEYWKDINNMMIAVFVPGCRNNMLDRGHIQYMGFGCCTLSPKIITMLPYDKKLIPGTHYLECSEDYLDIIEKIKWASKHVDACKHMGDNAKQLFLETCTPKATMIWIKKVLGGKAR